MNTLCECERDNYMHTKVIQDAHPWHTAAKPRSASPSATYLSCQVLQDSGRVDGSGGSHTSVACRAVLQVTMDTSDREL